VLYLLYLGLGVRHMERLGLLLTKKSLVTLGVAVLTITTLTSSGAAFVKIAQSFDDGETRVMEVKGMETQAIPNVATPQSIGANKSDNNTNSRLTANTPLPTVVNPSANPGRIVTSPSTQASLVTNNVSSCLVTLFGKTYDVMPLKSSHPGGDIFQCNTDMTAVYQSQHGTDVSRMQAYLVISGSGTTSGNTGSQTVGTGGSVSGSSFETKNNDDGDHEEEVEDEDKDEELEHAFEDAKDELESED